MEIQTIINMLVRKYVAYTYVHTFCFFDDLRLVSLSLSLSLEF